jgi:dienelactone hydrolase
VSQLRRPGWLTDLLTRTGQRIEPDRPPSERRAALAALLGLPVIAAGVPGIDHAATLVSSEEMDGYHRLLYELRTEPEVVLPVWCLVPGGPGPHPVAVMPHGHTHWGADQYVGIAHDAAGAEKIRVKRKDLAVQAVRRGFVAVAAPTRGFAPLDTPDVADRFEGRSCHAQLVDTLPRGRTPLGERIWDLGHVVAMALARPDVDPDRLVVGGHSGGGVLAWLYAALDERVAVAVANEAFTPFVAPDLSMRFCPCNTVPGLLGWGEVWDVAALIAPRALRIVSATEGIYPVADVDLAVARTRERFAAAGTPDSLQHQWCKGPCRMYPEAVWPAVDAALGRPPDRAMPGTQASRRRDADTTSPPRRRRGEAR